MQYEIVINEAVALGLAENRIPDTTAQELIARAAKKPTPIPDSLKKRAAEVSTPEDAAKVVADYRKLRAGDQGLDYSELQAAARASENAVKREHYGEVLQALEAELQAVWARLVDGVAGFGLHELGPDSGLTGEKSRTVSVLAEDLERLRRIVTVILRYAKAVHLPEKMLGFGERWITVALLTDIGAEDYETAHATYIQYSDLKDVKRTVEHARKNGYGLAARTSAEAQEILNAWGDLREWYWVDAQGNLNKLERLGAKTGHRVSKSRINRAVSAQQLRDAGFDA